MKPDALPARSRAFGTGSGAKPSNRTMTPRQLSAFTALALAGCASATPPAAPLPSDPADDLVRATLGQSVNVGGPRVTPLTLLEDSRCPMNARCVRAGEVRIRAKITLGRGSETRELTQGQPVPLADGTLELVEVQPDKIVGGDQAPLRPQDYRFGFRFRGGL